MKKKYTLFIMLSWYVLSITAQHIGGTVLNEQQLPLPYVTIRVLNIDSTFVQGAHTDSLGIYSMDLKQKGDYLLSISSIGYKSQTVPIKVQHSKQFPPIVLKTDNIELNEITIKATSFVRQNNKILIYPDKTQIKHSVTGYDVLYRLMIPEIDVDRLEGKVSTTGGEATLYIDGRKVEPQEIQSLNPKEIDKIEYYDIPTGKYMNDIAAINFITKKYKTGGYISLSGDQRIGYLKGNYNAVAKLLHNNTSYTLFIGHSMNNYSGTREDTQEHFVFTDHVTDRHSGTLESRIKNNKQYAQLNISNQKEKRSLTGKFSLVHYDIPDNYARNMLEYGNSEKRQESFKNTNQSGWKPNMDLYGYFHLNDKQFLEITLGGNYTTNTYNYTYQENSYSTLTDSKEDLYDLSAIINYGIQFKHQNTLTVHGYHFQTISSVDYKGNNPSWQHFWEGESMLFLDYNQKIGKKFSLTFGPGMSYIQYCLHGNKRKDKLSPRLHFNLMYYPAKNQQIRLACPIGSGYLQINQLNEVEQQIDSLQIRRGNSNQKIAFQTTPMVSYSGQLGKFNIVASVSYNIINNLPSEDFYIENNKLIRSYQSKNKHRMFSTHLSCAWKVTNNLRIKLAGSRISVKYKPIREKLEYFFGSMQVDYYRNDFSCGIFANSKNKWLNPDLVYGSSPAKYGGYISWNHKNWSLESGVMNPFTKDSKQVSAMNREMYRYKKIVTGKLYQPNGYVKVAYTFNFGKKTSRDQNDIDTNINSAILKAN